MTNPLILKIRNNGSASSPWEWAMQRSGRVLAVGTPVASREKCQRTLNRIIKAIKQGNYAQAN